MAYSRTSIGGLSIKWAVGYYLDAVRGINDGVGVTVSNAPTHISDIFSRIVLTLSSRKSLSIAIEFEISSALGRIGTGISTALEEYLNISPDVMPAGKEYSPPRGLPNDISQSLENLGEVLR